MGAIDRLVDAAGVLSYLDTTGDYGRLVREHLVVAIVRRIESDPDLAVVLRQNLDAHGALILMRDALDGLCVAA